MLGRKNYSQEELDRAKEEVQRLLDTHLTLSQAIMEAEAGSAAGSAEGAGPAVPATATAALHQFDALFFNNMALALDRPFVHRLRSITGKDSNPLNELELICDSLINNNGVFRANNVIKYEPEQSVVNLQVGDTIRLTRDDFERISAACFAELERKFL